MGERPQRWLYLTANERPRLAKRQQGTPSRSAYAGRLRGRGPTGTEIAPPISTQWGNCDAPPTTQDGPSIPPRSDVECGLGRSSPCLWCIAVREDTALDPT